MAVQAYPDSGYQEAQKLAIFSQNSLASLEASSTIFSTCLFGATGPANEDHKLFRTLE
jgi:hypothetical protein